MQTFRDLDKHLGMVPPKSAAALAEASAGRGREEAYGRQNPQVLEGLMQVALIQSSASSNAIEQITAAPGRVTELVQDKTTPKDRSEEEIAGYRKVLDTVHSSAEHIPLTSNVVLRFHRDIFAFSAMAACRGLEKLIEESKETYYLGILNAPYDEFEARAGNLMSGRGSKEWRRLTTAF